MIDTKYQPLLDLTETARQNNWDMDSIMNHFPELQGIDRQLLEDFVSTAHGTNYDMEQTLSLFPEFTGKYKNVFEEGGVGGNVYYGDAVAPREGEEMYDVPEVAEGQTVPMSTIDPAQAARIQNNIDQGVPTDQWVDGDFEAYVRTDEYAQAKIDRATESAAENDIRRQKAEHKNTVYRNSAEAYLEVMDNAAKEAEFEGNMQQNKVNPIPHFMLSEEAKVAHLVSQFENGNLDPNTLPNGEVVEAVAIPDIVEFEEEYGSIYDDRPTKEIKEEKEKQEELDKLTHESEINIDNPITIVNKDVGEVLGYFSEPEMIKKFPGLNVVTTGLVDHAVRFILPDGTSINMDLSPNVAGWLGLDTDANIKAQADNIKEQANKINEIKAWYKNNASKLEFMDSIDLFKRFGEREDGSLGDNESSDWSEDTLREINGELGLIGLKIKALGTKTYGRAGVVTTGKEYQLVDESGQALVGGQPGDIQKYLFHKVPESKWLTIKNNYAEDAMKILGKALQDQGKTFEDYTDTEDGIGSLATDLTRQKAFQTKLENAINTMSISDDAKIWLKYYFKNGWNVSDDWARDDSFQEGTVISPSLTSDFDIGTPGWAAAQERRGLYNYSDRYEQLVAAVNNGTLDKLLARFDNGDFSVWNQEVPVYGAGGVGAVDRNVRLGDEKEQVLSELTELLLYQKGTDGFNNVYNNVFDEKVLYNEALSRAKNAKYDYISMLYTKHDEDGYVNASVYNEATGIYEDVEVKPEMLASIINTGIRDPEYLQRIATTSDPYLDNTVGNFESLYKKYEDKGKEIRQGFEDDVAEQLKFIEQAGLGYSFTADYRPIIEGADEALVNKWQASINKVFMDHRALEDEFHKGLNALNGEFKKVYSNASDLGRVVNVEYDRGDLIAKDFRVALEAFTNEIPAFFGSRSAVLAGQSRNRGEAAYERMLDYETALKEGLGGRYASRVAAQQSLNMGVAIGTNLVLPGAGMWLAPTLFGMSAGGQQRIAIQDQMDTGEKAKRALQSLTTAYENNEVSRSEYIMGKADLDATIALGDLNILQRNGSVLAAGLIEGGITYAVGTVPNARTAIKNLSGIIDDAAKSTWRSRLGAVGSFLGNTGKQIGGEVLEEELIYFANELQAGLLTGREMDFSQWKEVAAASIIMAGPTNTATTAYGTYVQQVANEEWQATNMPKVEKLKNYTEQLRSGLYEGKGKEAEREAILSAMKIEAASLGMAMTGLEVDALVAGTTNVQELLKYSMSENSVHRKAGVIPGDKPITIKKKVNKYLKGLPKSERRVAETQLATIETERARIWEEVAGEYHNDVLSEGGLVDKIYGQSGLDVTNQMQDKKSSKYNSKFNRMSNKQKMMAVHEQLKSDQMQAEVDKAKSNKKIFKMMEMAVYGYEGGATETKAGKKRTTGKKGKRGKRKLKAEQEYFERVAAWGLSTRGQAISINTRGRENAKNILKQDILTGLNEDAIVEFENAEAMAQDVLSNWRKLGYKDEHTAKEVAEKIRSGKIAAQVTVNEETGKVQYITLDKVSAKEALMNGDLIQGTSFAHEIGHVLDSFALNNAETKQLAESIYESLNSNNILKQVNALAIARMTDKSMTEDARTRLKDESGRRGWDAKKNPVDFDKMTPRGIDEYIKAVQDVFMNGNHEVAKKKARKVGKQGVGNLWRQATGFSKSDFNFDSKGSGLNYLMGFIDAFDNGEISQQTKRKIAAKKAMSEEQKEAWLKERVGDNKASERTRVTQTMKDSSNRVQDIYDQMGMDGIQDIISEFEVIVNPNEGRGPRAYGTSIVEKYVKRLEVDEIAGHLGVSLQERRNAIAQAIYLDSRGLYGMVQKYNDDGNIRTDDQGNPVPLAGYINKYLEVRADEIVNDLLKEKAEARVDHKYDNMADVPSDDSAAEQERRSKGVKLYDRFGETGLDIHNSIVADVLNGTIKTDGKNYKTLGGKRFYEVMEMMGINPVNKAGKPKTGNLDQTDVSAAQRWIKKNLQSIRSAVIPMHSTIKMVKNPKTGKLEARPDKAVGIPGVLLNSPLFTKHTRKDNLTTYSFNDGLLDSEILAMFGINPGTEADVKLNEDRNLSQKIRALVKLVDMAMTNQSARVAMDMRGDPISEVLRVADGRNLNLFSERSAAPGIYDYLTETPVNVIQDQVYDVIQIAHNHGWGNAKFNKAIVDNGIDQAVVDYMEYQDVNRFFVEQDEEGFRDPIRAKIKEGLENKKEAQFWRVYLNDQLYFSEDGQKKVGERANKQLAKASIAMIESLPPKLVKALGKPFFGLVSSKRGLNKNNNQDVYDAFDARTTKESLAADDTKLDFDLKAIRKFNAGNGLALKIQRIQNEPRPKGKSKEQHAIDKQQKVDRLYGTELDAANEANSAALGYVINQMANIGTEADVGVKLGTIRLLEMATNNVLGFRGLTKLSMIQFSGESQAVWVGKNKKTGKLKYFDINPTAADRESYDVKVNDKHPDYKEAVKHSKELAEKKSKTEKGKWKKGWNQERVDNEAQALIPKRLRAKGEHITPSANLMRTIALELSNVWFNGGNISLATEKAILNFSQSLGTEIYSKVQDEELGVTSMADLARMAAIQNYGGLNIESFRNPRTGEQYTSILKSQIANEQLITETAAELAKIRRGDPKVNNAKRKSMGTIAEGLSDAELNKLSNDVKKAETTRKAIPNKDVIKVGRWNLDTSTKQGKKIAAELASIKTVSSSEFKKVGRWNLDTSTKEGKKIAAELEKIPTVSSSETKGMTAWDFDDTLATTKSNVIFTKDGETKVVSAEEFAAQGADLMAEGWVPDFSEFNKVTGGKPGPMFDEAMKRAKKYGTENTFILTARSSESAAAIKEFLDALGLNIPLENITGLANSTGEAKARWLLDKHAQGYNDIAFADDAMQNVEAVQKVFNQYDIKGKVEQARVKNSERASSDFADIMNQTQSELDIEFNAILGESMMVDPRKRFSAAKAKQRGKKKNKFKFFLPPSAEDFKGLMYSFLGKGEQGERHHEWFKEKLFDPFSKGYRRLNAIKQEVSNDVRSLKKAIPGIKQTLRSKVGDTQFTNEQAVRVYNWIRTGKDVPGLSRSDQQALIAAVESDVNLKAFAEEAIVISNKIGVFSNPGDSWLGGTLSSDFSEQIDAARETLLGEFLENSRAIFSAENMNKIEAVYGTNFREALEDILYRMETGSTRPAGANKLTNDFVNWINGSVGTTMFFNGRSATLQMISNVNFMNWHDNNPVKAAKVFANQPQYWKDVAMIFNSNYLKQRRGGIGTDLNAAELLRDMKDSPNKMKTAVAKLLQLGFTPTQIADSLAIATGGATMYRNRIGTYLKEGMTKTEAESRAFEDMMEVSEETQQSARPDKISQQQASPLGKLILAFQNTPMQYNRIMKRSMQDWVNGRGDPKEHASKIAYYGAVQSMIFYGLQTALFSVMFGDDDEDDIEQKQSRILNGMMDSLLRGAGFTGAVVSTVKNTILKHLDEKTKEDDDLFYTEYNEADVLIEALNLSPPIGIKARKIVSGLRTWEYNQDIIDHMSKTDIDNPMYDATFSITEAVTNVPLSRLYSKYQNLSEAMNSDNETWQRIAMFLGWSRWNFGIQNSDVMSAKDEVKEIKTQEKEERKQQKKAEKEAEAQAQNKAVIDEHIEEQEQQREDGVDESEITCAAISRSGNRCGKKILPGQSYCTIHEEVEQRADNKKVQCSHVKANGDRCKMKTTNKSGKCYYHD